jgi:electron transfer flavoprotein alpha subunit
MEPTIVIIAEHSAGKLMPITNELIACALKLQQIRPAAIRVVIVGEKIEGLAREIAQNSGLTVIAVQARGLTGYNGEAYRNLLNRELGGLRPSYILVAHTCGGLDFAPALAVDLGAACISGVENVFEEGGRICFSRPLYGGKIVAHVNPTSEATVVTIQPGIFKPVANRNLPAGTVEFKTSAYRPLRSRSLGGKPAEGDISGISEADILVAAGRGIGSKENLKLIHQLARLFPKAAVAGSRIVCDLGWLPYSCQVGATGATVMPDLYIACGISGAVQHIAGMRASGFIVAINTDPAAAIFQVADICIVENLVTFIPVIIEEYKKHQDK